MPSCRPHQVRAQHGAPPAPPPHLVPTPRALAATLPGLLHIARSLHPPPPKTADADQAAAVEAAVVVLLAGDTWERKLGGLMGGKVRPVRCAGALWRGVEPGEEGIYGMPKPKESFPTGEGGI